MALAAFAAAMAVAVLGGSLFIFLVKGGTVSLLVRAEREAAALEEPPLQPACVATAAVFSVERFIDGSRALFPRFVRLGGVLMVVYALSGLALLATACRRGAGRPAGDGGREHRCSCCGLPPSTCSTCWRRS